jgi:hypothetical protein
VHAAASAPCDAASAPEPASCAPFELAAELEVADSLPLGPEALPLGPEGVPLPWLLAAVLPLPDAVAVAVALETPAVLDPGASGFVEPPDPQAATVHARQAAPAARLRVLVGMMELLFPG